MENNCEKIRELLFDYAAGGADGDFAGLEAHLSVCGSCRRELEECKRIIASVKESAPTPPADMKQNVMLAVSADAKLRRRRRLIGRATAVAAVFVVCAGIGIAALSSGAFNMVLDMEASGDADAPMAEDINGMYGSDASEDKLMHDGESPEGGGVGDSFDDVIESIDSEAAVTARKIRDAYGYESVVVFVLAGEDADSALAALCGEFEAKELEDGIYVFDAADASGFASRTEELAGEMTVYFDAYEDSDSPEIAAVYVSK